MRKTICHVLANKSFNQYFSKDCRGRGVKPLSQSEDCEIPNTNKAQERVNFQLVRDEKRENPCEGFSL